MKVSASPFETPRDFATSVTDAGERARAAEAQNENRVSQAAAISDVKSNLDPATRESLAKLASLIRSQLQASDQAVEASQEEARRLEEEVQAKEVRTERALKILQGSGEDETILRERVTGANYPAVERIEKRFREERRKRGVKIYTSQKTRESVDQILAALEGVKPPEDLFGEGDPFGEDAA